MFINYSLHTTPIILCEHPMTHSKCQDNLAWLTWTNNLKTGKYKSSHQWFSNILPLVLKTINSTEHLLSGLELGKKNIHCYSFALIVASSIEYTVKCIFTFSFLALFLLLFCLILKLTQHTCRPFCDPLLEYNCTRQWQEQIYLNFSSDKLANTWRQAKTSTLQQFEQAVFKPHLPVN